MREKDKTALRQAIAQHVPAGADRQLVDERMIRFFDQLLKARDALMALREHVQEKAADPQTAFDALLGVFERQAQSLFRLGLTQEWLTEQAIGGSPQIEVLADAAVVPGAVAALAADAAPQPSAEEEPDRLEMGLDEFFSQVGEGLLSAADRIDQESLRRMARRSPGVPPTLYAIPRLEASVKTAFRKSSGGRLGLLVWSRRREEEETRESTVTVEIAAVPPAPGEERPARVLGDLLPEGEPRRLLLLRLAAIRDASAAGKTTIADPVWRRTVSFALVEGANLHAATELAGMGEASDDLLVWDLGEAEDGRTLYRFLRRSEDGGNLGAYDLWAARRPGAAGEAALELILRSSVASANLPADLLPDLDRAVRDWLAGPRPDTAANP